MICLVVLLIFWDAFSKWKVKEKSLTTTSLCLAHTAYPLIRFMLDILTAVEFSYRIHWKTHRSPTLIVNESWLTCWSIYIFWYSLLTLLNVCDCRHFSQATISKCTREFTLAGSKSSHSYLMQQWNENFTRSQFTWYVNTYWRDCQSRSYQDAFTKSPWWEALHMSTVHQEIFTSQ